MLTLMTKINTQFKSTIMTGLIIILVLALAAVGVLVVMLLRARENGARMQEQVRILGEEQRRLKADSRLVFKDVAQQLLSEQSRVMREQNDVRMGEIVKPLRENLESLKRTIDGYKTEQVSTMEACVSHLKVGGRVGVITFQSLEDRIIKKAFKEMERDCICPPELPVCVCHHHRLVKSIGKAQKPSAKEIEENPRARRAVLRVVERV